MVGLGSIIVGWTMIIGVLDCVGPPRLRVGCPPRLRWTMILGVNIPRPSS